MANVRLAGGVSLRTGASGIGKQTALAFAEAAVDGILLADQNEVTQATIDECIKLAKNPNFRVVQVQTDVTDEANVANMVETAVKESGRVNYCVHVAGMGGISGARTEHLNVEVFDITLAVNARGIMLVLRAVSAAMDKQQPLEHQSHRHRNSKRSLGRGSIVVIASINATISAQAIDNVKHHIRLNTLYPSWTDTAMMQASLKRFPPLAKMIENVTPFRRAAMPEEVADVAVLLCSPAASYVNGASLLVDAGMTLPAIRNSM
ncbi:oxidoreductase [Aspergillus karnatakaensis]|uniref:oxidoreductase n=1 Tax=Aspergillus karnatakaensis TaxID=1810916 RepID=UPI003CCD3EED